MARGCFICIKIILEMIAIWYKIIWVISENSLSKILILGINDKEFLFFWSFKRHNLIFGLQDQCFY